MELALAYYRANDGKMNLICRPFSVHDTARVFAAGWDPNGFTPLVPFTVPPNKQTTIEFPTHSQVVPE